jgi:hypothetical protein
MFTCGPHECTYCRSPIVSGQRWVREKIYEHSLSSSEPSYRRYHADLFDGQDVSCWEKHQIEQQSGRTTARAA